MLISIQYDYHLHSERKNSAKNCKQGKFCWVLRSFLFQKATAASSRLAQHQLKLLGIEREKSSDRHPLNAAISGAQAHSRTLSVRPQFAAAFFFRTSSLANSVISTSVRCYHFFSRTSLPTSYRHAQAQLRSSYRQPRRLYRQLDTHKLNLELVIPTIERPRRIDKGRVQPEPKILGPGPGASFYQPGLRRNPTRRAQSQKLKI